MARLVRGSFPLMGSAFGTIGHVVPMWPTMMLLKKRSLQTRCHSALWSQIQ